MAFQTICVDHVGIACADLGAASWFYCDVLGLEVTNMEEVPEQGVATVFIPCGETLLELIVDITEDNDGPVGRYIERNGPGIQHIALRVDDVVAAINSCQAAGVKMIDQEPRSGAGGMDVAFIHPRSAGLLMELCAPQKSARFTYTQESYAMVHDQLLFKEKNFEKLADFEEAYGEQYGDGDYTRIAYRPWVYDLSLKAEKYGLPGLLAYREVDYDNLLNWTALIVDCSILAKVYGWREYQYSSAYYYWNNYDTGEDIDDFYIKALNGLNLGKIKEDLKAAALENAYFVTDIYEKYIDSAIAIHQAYYLNSLRPTKEQKQMVAEKVYNLILKEYSLIGQQLPAVLQKQQYFLNMVHQLQRAKQNLDGSLVDNLLRGWSVFSKSVFHPVFGAAEVARQGYDLYKKDQKMNAAYEELSAQYNSFLEQLAALEETINNCDSNLLNSLKTQIIETYLLPGINQVAQILMQNGKRVKPFYEYMQR